MTDEIVPGPDPLSPAMYRNGFYDASGRPLAALHKRYLKTFLRELRETSHHIFVLLDHLPTKWFEIVRYADYRNRNGGREYRGLSSHYSLGMFYQNAGDYHPLDEFRVLFYGQVYYYEQELTAGRFRKQYEHFLRCQCREGLRGNTPIVLTRELIRKYGLTRNDAAIVGQYLDRFNAEAIRQMQEEYDLLKRLDCIPK